MTDFVVTILIQGFLEAIATVMIASMLNNDIKLGMAKLLVYAVILAALSLFMSIVQVPFHTLITIPAMALIYLLIKQPSRKTALNYFIDIVLALFVLSLLQMIVSFMAIGVNINLMENNVARIVTMLLIITVFVILSSRKRVVLFFERFYIPFRKTVILTIVFLIFMNTIFSDLFFYNSEEFIDKMSSSLLALVIGYFIASALIGIALFRTILLTHKSKTVFKYSEHQDNIINEYRIKTHDYNNVIQTIKVLNKNEDGTICNEKINEYIEEINDVKNRKDDLTIVKDNVFISAVLYMKKEYAKGNHIDFHVSVSNAQAIYKISDTDLLEVLNNLIDNAFEEVLLLPFGNRSVFVEFNENSIKVINSIPEGEKTNDESILFEQGYTTKGTGRGSGLAKVRTIAESYNIRIKTTWENNKIIFNLTFEET